MNEFVLTKVNVISMTNENILRDMNIHIKDGAIKGVFKGKPKRGLKKIKAKGKYVIPGLTDMHIHFRDEIDLKTYIVNGVLTVRDMMARDSIPALEWRKQIKNGTRVGPNMYLCSKVFEGPGESAMEFMAADGFTRVTSKEEVIREVKAAKEKGYDYIKIYDLVQKGEFDAILAESKKHGIKAVGHVPVNVGYEHVYNSKMHTVEHIMGNEQEHINLIAKSKKWIVATVIPMHKFEFIWENDRNEYLRNDPKTKYIPQSLLSVWEFAVNLKKALDPETLKIWEERAEYIKKDVVNPILKELHQKGAKVLVGTDCGIQFVYPGFSVHEELEIFTDCGFTPYEALQAATVHSAEALECLESSGTVEEGKNADLVILNSNPLNDISNTKDIHSVIKSGKLFNRKTLNKMLDEIVQYCDSTKVDNTENNSMSELDGIYKKGIFKFQVVGNEKEITVKAMGKQMLYKYNEADNKFVFVDDKDVYITFNRNEKGEIESLDSRFMGKTTTMTRVK